MLIKVILELVFFGYKSHKQGLFSEPVREFEAKVCLDCGYTEMYINVEKLKRKVK